MKIRLFKILIYFFLGLIVLLALDRLFGIYIYPTFSYIKDRENRKEQEIINENALAIDKSKLTQPKSFRENIDICIDQIAILVQ